MKAPFYFSILFFLFISCEEDPIPSFNIDPELKPYVDVFLNEAEQRGISFDQGLDALFKNDLNVCGQGHAPDFNGMFDKPTILIDNDCWITFNEVAKEILIFHELGHALLNRIHIEGVLPNGSSKSIMCAGNAFDCSDLPDYSFCPDYRTYYVDELFDETENPPQWALRNWSPQRSIYSDQSSDFFSGWKIFSNCPENSYKLEIDSTSQNRPSNYSLKLSSSCGDYVTFQKKIGIDEFIAPEAVRYSSDLYHSLTGEAFRIQLFVEDNKNEVIAFNRSVPREIINAGNTIDDFRLQAECIQSEVDTLSLNLIFWKDTEGEVLIGNMKVELMK